MKLSFNAVVSYHVVVRQPPNRRRLVPSTCIFCCTSLPKPIRRLQTVGSAPPSPPKSRPWPTPGEPSRHVIPGPLFQFVHFPNAIFTDEERARTTRWGCSRGVHHQLDLALLEFSLISYGSADGPGFQKGIGPWQRTGPVWTAVVRLAIDRSIDRIYDVQQNPPSFIPLQCASRTNLL
jgi:hypothetical protein